MHTDIMIALIEDDPLLRSVLAGLIEDLGTHCLDFPSADDALVALVQRPLPVDLLVCDMVTPGQLNGLELITLCRQRWPALPVLLISGYDQGSHGIPATVPYLQKPLQVMELISRVSEVIHRRRGSGSVQAG